MRRYCATLLAVGIAAWAACGMAQAQSSLPEPYRSIDGETAISQFNALDYPTAPDDIFLNAMLWAINNTDKSEGSSEGFADIDYDKRQFEFTTSLESKKLGVRYAYTLGVRVTDNIITLLAREIGVESEVAVVKLTKKLSFDKLQPEKKPKHKDYLDDFAKLFLARVTEIESYVSTHTPPVVEHWVQIKTNQVVKGMTEDECLLSLGKPATMSTQGNQTEWMYDAYTYLFFENGVLKSFIK